MLVVQRSRLTNAHLLDMQSCYSEIAQIAPILSPTLLRFCRPGWSAIRKQRIEVEFSDQYGFTPLDRQIATDYLHRGTVSLATVVNGDHHFWHTNKDEIARVVSLATEQEQAQYQRGMQLSKTNQQTTLNSSDSEALGFYNKLSSALNQAGNSRSAASHSYL